MLLPLLSGEPRGAPPCRLPPALPGAARVGVAVDAEAVVVLMSDACRRSKAACTTWARCGLPAAGDSPSPASARSVARACRACSRPAWRPCGVLAFARLSPLPTVPTAASADACSAASRAWMSPCSDEMAATSWARARATLASVSALALRSSSPSWPHCWRS